MYESGLPDANKSLLDFAAKIKEYQVSLAKFEEQRCEQIHSSINQFVVFEKFAEMNNKYDVKNFSDLIDSYELQEEVKTIETAIKEEVAR